MEILVVKLSAIGDVVHSLPAVNLLRKRVPGAKITWVVEPLSTDLLLGNPLVDRVVVFEKKRFKSVDKGSTTQVIFAPGTRFLSRLTAGKL